MQKPIPDPGLFPSIESETEMNKKEKANGKGRVDERQEGGFQSPVFLRSRRACSKTVREKTLQAVDPPGWKEGMQGN
jgi:hypothetical protein